MSAATPEAQAALPPGSQVVERPVHSIDHERRTGSKASHIVAIIFIGIIVLIAVIFLVLGFNTKSAANLCAQTESITCYSLTCPAGVTTETCAKAPGAPDNGGAYALRCTSDTTVQCNWAPGVEQNIATGESYLCAGKVAAS